MLLLLAVTLSLPIRIGRVLYVTMVSKLHKPEKIADDLQALAYPVSKLRELPGNAHKGDDEAVRKLYVRVGQRKPLVARHDPDDPDVGIIYAGNTQLRVVRDLGWQNVAVAWADDLTDDEIKAFAIGDNRTSQLGEDDPELLLTVLEEVRRADESLLADISYGPRELAALHRAIARNLTEGLSDPDDAPDTPETPRTRRGDVWLLGPHRLVCGDAADGDVLEALMTDDAADMLWTDPPYGVEVTGGDTMTDKGGRRGAGTISNDTADEVESLLTAVIGGVNGILVDGAPWYVCHPVAGALYSVTARVVAAAGWRTHETLIWVKDQLVPGRSDYHYKHEPILYGYTAGDGPVGRFAKGPQWHGGNDETSVIEVPRPKRSKAHPTMKPVALIERCVRNSSSSGDLVLDPFAGSGSTLIACHRLGRVARLVEIDPRYCDVICARYHEFTGDKAVLESTGEVFA